MIKITIRIMAGQMSTTFGYIFRFSLINNNASDVYNKIPAAKFQTDL